jgi:Domain of unknown function (DUF1995)
MKRCFAIVVTIFMAFLYGKVVSLQLSIPLPLPSRMVVRSRAPSSIRITAAIALKMGMDDNDLVDNLLTARQPTSVEDQVRQAAACLQRATADSRHRHLVRLLLPLIGATELDDWPGGSRQQMEAACPLVEGILQQQIALTRGEGRASVAIQKSIIDESDGVAALMAQATTTAQDDSCTVLLPTAETIAQSVATTLEASVGPQRNLILVNPQYRRRSDFGSNWFGSGGSSISSSFSIDYVEQFEPTFSLTNLMCEGESVRVLRTYPGPWRVFIRVPETATGLVDWQQIGSQDVIREKPCDWSQRPINQRDGGAIFNYGQPSYQDITDMLYSGTLPNFTPKSPAERATAAFSFIKDTL